MILEWSYSLLKALVVFGTMKFSYVTPKIKVYSTFCHLLLERENISKCMLAELLIRRELERGDCLFFPTIHNLTNERTRF
jgi:hypothetical protein